MLISWHSSIFLPDVLRSLDIIDSERGKRGCVPQNDFDKLGNYFEIIYLKYMSMHSMNCSSTSSFPIEGR